MKIVGGDKKRRKPGCSHRRGFIAIAVVGPSSVVPLIVTPSRFDRFPASRSHVHRAALLGRPQTKYAVLAHAVIDPGSLAQVIP